MCNPSEIRKFRGGFAGGVGGVGVVAEGQSRRACLPGAYRCRSWRYSGGWRNGWFSGRSSHDNDHHQYEYNECVSHDRSSVQRSGVVRLSYFTAKRYVAAPALLWIFIPRKASLHSIHTSASSAIWYWNGDVFVPPGTGASSTYFLFSILHKTHR